MAEYKETSLTKLAALKALAEKVAKDYTEKTEFNTLSTKVDGLVTAGGEPNKIEKIKVNGQEQSITPADKSVDITVPTKVKDLTDNADYATKEEVKAQVSAVYKPGGSVEFSELPAATKDNLGTVYNVSDAFTTDTKFVEGTGKSYPAGTNVVVVDAGSSSYKYDVLAGFVDLSGYVKKDGSKVLSTNDYTTAEKTKLAGIEDNANNYTHPEGDGNLHVPETGTTNANKVLTAGATAGSLSWGHKVEKDVPSTAKFTDTTYTNATASKAGLMSMDDKKKLDDIEIATDEEVQAMLDEVFSPAE